MYSHWIKTSLSYNWHFYQRHFQKMVGRVAFKASLLFMLKFKSFKMSQPVSLFISYCDSSFALEKSFLSEKVVFGGMEDWRNGMTE